ncbi:NAC domain-containing protein 67-like [Carica papaya]|uniref:NAC domain-containing protein 67-like n=1 Tax=Carica papaya TaxID=3649 RepID=UPI000B8D0A80|nr:NAC domain-containing protein 67-like [Carica papaya]
MQVFATSPTRRQNVRTSRTKNTRRSLYPTALFPAWRRSGRRAGAASTVTFNPTDQHLVAYFLRNKIHGRQSHLLNIFIIDADVYESHPAALPWELYPGLTCSYRYYFTRRHKVSANCNPNRPKRTVDCGWWRSDTGDKDILHRGKVIGRKKTLSFFVYKDTTKKRKDAQKTGWIMHEYRLADDSFQEWVLCKIYNKPNKKNKNFEMETADSSICETAILSENQLESILVETDYQHGRSDNTPQNVEERSYTEYVTDWASLFWGDNEQPVANLQSY